MTIYYKNQEKIKEGTGLLISILLRYPEINTIKIDPQSEELRFSFLLQEVLSKESLQSFQKRLEDSISLFCSLKNEEENIPRLVSKNYGGYSLLEVRCQIFKLSRSLLALVIDLICASFEARMMKEEVRGALYGTKEQEELIDDMFSKFKDTDHLQQLIGLRKDGKVMVFDRS